MPTFHGLWGAALADTFPWRIIGPGFGPHPNDIDAQAGLVTSESFLLRRLEPRKSCLDWLENAPAESTEYDGIYHGMLAL